MEDVSEASLSSTRSSIQENAKLLTDTGNGYETNSLNRNKCDINSGSNKQTDVHIVSSSKQYEDSNNSSGPQCNGEQCKLLECGKGENEGCGSIGNVHNEKDEVDRVSRVYFDQIICIK